MRNLARLASLEIQDRRKRRKPKPTEPTQGFSFRKPQDIGTTILGLMIVVVLVLPLHAGWYAAVSGISGEARATTELDSLSLQLQPNSKLVIGRNDLVQRAGVSSAETEHVEFSMAATPKTAVLRNIANRRNLNLGYGKSGTTSVNRWRINHGDSLFIREYQLDFELKDDAALAFSVSDGGQSATYSIASGGGTRPAQKNGSELRKCSASGGPSLKSYFQGSVRRVALLGGRLDCQLDGVVHIPVSALPWQAMAIFSDSKGFHLRPAQAAASELSFVRFSRDTGEEFTGFGALRHSLGAGSDNPLRRMIIGKTHYGVDVSVAEDGASVDIVIKPERTSHLFSLDPSAVPQNRVACRENLPGVPVAGEGFTRCLASPASVTSRGTGADILSLISDDEQYVRLALFFAGLAYLAFLLIRPVSEIIQLRKARSAAKYFSFARLSNELGLPFATTAIVLLLSALPELLQFGGMQRLGIEQGLNVTVLSYALLCSYAVIFNARSLSFCLGLLSFVALIATGTVVLFSLALDGNTTRSLDFIIKHKLLFLDLLAVMLVIVITMPSSFLRWLVDGFLSTSRISFWIRLAVAAIPLGIMVILAAFGSEEGLGAFQPVELAKISIVLLLAVLVTGLDRQIDHHRAGAFRGFLVGAFCLLFLYAVFLGGVPLYVSDLSPVLIVTITSIVMFALFMPQWAFFRLDRLAGIALHRRRLPVMRRLPLESARRGKWLSYSVIGVSLGLILLVYFTPQFVNFGLTGQFSMTSNIEQQLERYKNNRPGGAFGTVADRFYSYRDVSHDPALRKPGEDGQDVFVVYNSQLGLQSIRSKQAIANAPCGFGYPFLAGTEAGRVLSTAIEWIVSSSCRGVPLDWNPENFGLPQQEPQPQVQEQQSQEQQQQDQQQQDQQQQALAEENDQIVSPEEEETDNLYFLDELVSVPVIQNDFIGAYVMARGGLAYAFVTILLQCLIIVFLAGLWFWLRPSPNMPVHQILSLQFLRMTLAGIACLFALHWLIAWSNVLGLLPIMGQPMSLSAAATSHHLFMVAPAILMMIIAIRYPQKPFTFRLRRPPRPGIAGLIAR